MSEATDHTYRQRPDEDDWTFDRRVALTGRRAPDWPPEVQGISVNGLSLLGIHEKTRELYWDGKPIVTRRPIKLGTYERWVAGIAAASTFGGFVLQVGKAVGWWIGP